MRSTPERDPGEEELPPESNKRAGFLRMPGKLFFSAEELDIDTIALAPDQPQKQQEISLCGEGLPPLPDADEYYKGKTVIAHGGQGTVFRVEDLSLHRAAALKTLSQASGGTRKRYIEKIQLMAQLDHPAIIPVYGLCGDREERLHIAMKLVDGKNLRDYLRKLNSTYAMLPASLLRYNEKKSLRRRLHIFQKVCEAVAFAHHKGVVHRDLKPENIMVGRFSEVYVVDWGMACCSGMESQQSSSSGIGTVHYSAPELLLNNGCDKRMDIYSLGLILFSLAYLKQAYPGDADVAAEAVKQGRMGTFRHRFDVPVARDLEKIIRKAAAFDPQERYQSVEALMRDVEAFLSDEEVSANPDSPLGRCLRGLMRRRKLLVSVSVLAVLFALTACLLFLWQALQTRTMQQIRDRALLRVNLNGITAATEFENRIRVFTELVHGLRREIEIYLFRNLPPEPIGRFYNYRDGSLPEKAPPNFRYAPAYHQKISFDEFVYKTPDDLPLPGQEKMLEKIAPLKASLRKLILDNPGELISRPGNHQDREEDARKYAKPTVGFAFISLKNGLHITYPFHDDYKPAYDPRQRQWYIDTMNSQDYSTHWTAPYIDNGSTGDIIITCSTKFFDHNEKFAGCIGMDIVLGRMIDLLLQSGNSGAYVKSKILIDRDNRVVTDTSDSHKVAIDRAAQRVRFPEFDNPALLKMMWRQKRGHLQIGTPNGPVLYFFMKIPSLDWLYIEEIDYMALLKHQSELDEKGAL